MENKKNFNDLIIKTYFDCLDAQGYNINKMREKKKNLTKIKQTDIFELIALLETMGYYLTEKEQNEVFRFLYSL